MERGNGFEPSHPRVEALVHSLFYVTPAYKNVSRLYKNESESQKFLHARK